MGREVRMVAPDWKHPKDARGRYKPLHEGYSLAVEERQKWREGFRRDYATGEWGPKDEHDAGMSVEDYFGSEEADPDDYMPEWPPEVATHYQMYETTSEGTPISPPMPTPEALARWLADNNASAFGSMGASYEGWLATIKRGSAPSAVLTPEVGLQSGVEGLK